MLHSFDLCSIPPQPCTPWQFRGSIQDGINSLTRYYLNNFCDGRNQDVLDLFHGRFVPDRTKPSPYKAGAPGQAASIPSLLLRVAVVLGVVFGAWAAAGPEEWTPSPRGLLGLFAVSHLAVSAQLILSRGRAYVDKPRLLPETE